MTDKPVVLTPSLAAEWFSEHGPDGRANRALSDVVDGRTVVIPVWTEAQAREAFEKAQRDSGVPQVELTRDKDSYALWDVAMEWNGWLACARHLGAVKEEK